MAGRCRSITIHQTNPQEFSFAILINDKCIHEPVFVVFHPIKPDSICMYMYVQKINDVCIYACMYVHIVYACVCMCMYVQSVCMTVHVCM